MAEALDRGEFERLVRDALANLFDQAALATHPLAPVIGRQGGTQPGRSDQLRAVLLNAIEHLKPAGEQEPRPGSQEWRPYLLLHGRYVDGASLQQLQASLALSERHLRREHSRAVQAVATYLLDTLLPDDAGTKMGPAEESAATSVFPVTLVPLDIMDLLQGVVLTVQRRAQSEGARLEIIPQKHSPWVLSDRVILRQVLLSLLSYVLDRREDGPVIIAAEGWNDRVLLRIEFNLEDSTLLGSGEEDRDLDQACFWCDRIDACLSRSVDQPGRGRVDLSLPSADEPLLLVVDDQESAVRMFQRYLSHASLRLVGVHDGAEVLPLARQLRPRAITLDIMMPNMDGWEVLQSLQADPLTRHIPVIVCSVWEEPELASSLGAADFLAKPIRQKDLLTALERLHLLDT
jgi:CheY-like chemotaxis protein